MNASVADEATKSYRHGTHRTVSPAETLARIRPAFQRIGITRLSEITGLDCIGLPVAQAVRPLARNLSVNQGKGRTADEALASAAMEAAETWHAERVRATVRGTPSEMRRRRRIVDPADMAASAADPGAHDGVAMDWVEGQDVWTGEPILVPFDCVGMDYTAAPDSDLIARSSNGLASGNSAAEALTAALFELIERDSVADFLHLDVPGRDRLRLRRAALRQGPLAAEVGRIEAAGLWLEVWDITGRLGVPAFRARISGRERAGAIYRLPASVGAGCHLDPVVALSRALTEAVQCRLTLISGTRDDIEARHYREDARAASARIGAALFADSAARNFEAADQSGDSALADAGILLDRLAQEGLDLVVAVDLTDPAIGIAVVRAVVPGLAVVSGPSSYRRVPRPGGGDV